MKLDIQADFPEKLEFLFHPARYKVPWGGRGGAKSWGIARALLALATKSRLRILCAREIQKSIADSVHALLKDQIVALGASEFYEAQETRIIGANGTEFIFAGLRHNIASLKSVEGCDIAWVEEAQTVSKESWDVLIPTVRKDGSEIWVSFNPKLPTDDTYKRFILHPPPGAVVVKIGWRDNPWFPEVLRIEKDHLEATDRKAYLHVWEGECLDAIDGAIYANEIKAAEAAGRICKVSHDRTRPVHTFWDLGYGDSTAIWFAQALPDGSYRLIDYLEDHGKTIADYVIALQNKAYLYGVDWVPHDGVDAIIHKRLAGGDTSRSIEQLMRAAGRNVRLAPKLHVTSGINAARTIFPQCWFDSEKCADGLQSLRHYQWTPATGLLAQPDPRKPQAPAAPAGTPLHNWASHGADAFRTLAVAIKAPAAAPQRSASPPRPRDEKSWMG